MARPMVYFIFKIRWPIRWCKGLVLVLGGQGQGNSERLEYPCCHGTHILHNFELFPTKYVDDLVDSESQETAKSTYPTFFAKGSTVLECMRNLPRGLLIRMHTANSCMPAWHLAVPSDNHSCLTYRWNLSPETL